MTRPADFEFLDREGQKGSSFLHEDPWRVFRMLSDVIGGIETMVRGLEGCERTVAVFGSARTPPSDPYYQQAYLTAKLLAKERFAVITGGGPGIMEAANLGAKEAGSGKSVGLNIELPVEQQANPHVDVAYECHYFFVRKMLFAKYAHAFVIFPGGYGTMDELFESLTLIQTGRLASFPVILFGSDYWTPLVNWMQEKMLASGCIDGGDLRSIAMTNDPEEVVRWLVESENGKAYLNGGLHGIIERLHRPLRVDDFPSPLDKDDAE